MGRQVKRAGWLRRGEHDGCPRCDLCVRPEHGQICPSCGTPTVKCEGPERAGTPYAGCVECYHPGAGYALARRLGGAKFWTETELRERLSKLKARLAEAEAR